MAESFAETEFKDTVSEVSHVKTLLDTSSLTASTKCTEIKSIPPNTSFKELLETATVFISNLPAVPQYDTFVKVYHSEKWTKILRWRHEGNHSVCTECEKLKAYRRQAHSSKDMESVLRAYHLHLEQMHHDRSVDARINMKAIQSVIKGGKVDGPKLLSLTVDGMDTSKYKCPRNLVLTKEIEGAYRPELKMTGILVEGLLEGYFIIPDMTPKDSNLTISLVNHSLWKVKELLDRQGLGMPEEIRIHSDNAPADQKNVHMLRYAAFLVSSGFFKRATLSMFRRGHSHSKIDQRFSEVRGSLSRAKLLESPDCFQAAIAQGVRARDRRQLHVEVVYGSHDWRKFLEEHMGSSVSGHVQTSKMTKNNMQACHYFEFCQRRHLQAERHGSIQQPDDFKASDTDIIMETKLYVASPMFAQLPIVFAPASMVEAIPGVESIGFATKNALGDKMIKEYTKTAQLVASKPWNMKKAQLFLTTLCGKHWQDRCTLKQLPADASSWTKVPDLEDHLDPKDTNFVNREAHPVTVKFTASKSKPAGPVANQAAGSADVQPPSVTDAGDLCPGTPSDLGDAQMPKAASPKGAPAPKGPPAPKNSPVMKRPGSNLQNPAPKAKAKTAQAAPAKAAPAKAAPAKAAPAKAAPAKAAPKPAPAKAAPKAGAKAEAKAKAKAKAVNPPPGVTLGCGKCRGSGFGCKLCRTKAGMKFDPVTKTWN